MEVSRPGTAQVQALHRQPTSSDDIQKATQIFKEAVSVKVEKKQFFSWDYLEKLAVGIGLIDLTSRDELKLKNIEKVVRAYAEVHKKGGVTQKIEDEYQAYLHSIKGHRVKKQIDSIKLKVTEEQYIRGQVNQNNILYPTYQTKMDQIADKNSSDYKKLDNASRREVEKLLELEAIPTSINPVLNKKLNDEERIAAQELLNWRNEKLNKLIPKDKEEEWQAVLSLAYNDKSENIQDLFASTLKLLIKVELSIKKINKPDYVPSFSSYESLYLSYFDEFRGKFIKLEFNEDKSRKDIKDQLIKLFPEKSESALRADFKQLQL